MTSATYRLPPGHARHLAASVLGVRYTPEADECTPPVDEPALRPTAGGGPAPTDQ
jgi:hypothetical protein